MSAVPSNPIADSLNNEHKQLSKIRSKEDIMICKELGYNIAMEAEIWEVACLLRVELGCNIGNGDLFIPRL